MRPLIEQRQYTTGLVTQSSPLTERPDRLIDGITMEISPSLTLVRRCGHSVFNSQTFPRIARFYEFRVVVDGVAQVRLLADTAQAVYDATGPNTKQLLWTKSAAATGKTCFQSVGNTLYFSTGPEQKKWLYPTKAWAAGKTFNAGEWIVDEHNNIQLLQPQATATVTQVAITGNIASILFNGSSPFATGQPVTFTGLTQASFLNGQTLTVLPGTFINGVRCAFNHADYAQAAETGTASYGAASGVTGGVEPKWSTAIGGYTVDGGLLWMCWGSAVQNWGIASPTTAPSVTQATLPSNYPGWTANTTYSTSLSLVDGNGNVQVLTTSGKLGTAEPAWNKLLGGATQDGTAVWTCNGTAQWSAGEDYALGDVVKASYTYYVQVYQPNSDNDAQREYQYGYNSNQQQSQNNGTYTQQPVTVTELFRCSAAGTSGTAQPDWSSAPGIGSVVSDNTVTWTNLGNNVSWSSYGAGATLSQSQIVVDSKGYLQQIAVSGVSGATEPVWVETLSTSTTDNTVTWTNLGPYSAAGTGGLVWAFSYKCSIDGSVSSASDKSITVLVSKGMMPVVQGATSKDPQADTIVVWRTGVGGGQLLYETEFPMPSGPLWTYFDTLPDAALVAQILAPIDGVNDPPPTGISALAFHVNRLWAAVNNKVFYCTGPDTTVGNGFTAWSESNQFGYPDSVIRMEPVTLSNGALLCFTTSDVQSVFGLGTPDSPFYPTRYIAGVGLLGADALDVVGATIHLFTTAAKQVSLDPSAGYLETGLPIGDQFRAVTTGSDNALPYYNPADVFVSWHEAGSGDTGLYVCDGGVGWFRYSPVSGSGFAWSPRAAVEGGTSAVRSVETAPGVRALLVGPCVSGPILKRDLTVYADDGTPYGDSYAVVGSIRLADSGEIAEVAHVALDSKRVGTAPTVAMLFGEIAPTDDVPFDTLERTAPDPALLPAAATLFNDRFATMQNEVCPMCRHLQIKIQLASEDAASEVLQHALYGEVFDENTPQ